jgi:hypothetical protein
MRALNPGTTTSYVVATVKRRRRHAMRSQQSDLMGQSSVVGDDRPTLAASGVLIRVEAETPDVAVKADRLVVVSREQRVGRILDHRDAALTCDVEDRVHVAGEAGIVHYENGCRVVGDRR